MPPSLEHPSPDFSGTCDFYGKFTALVRYSWTDEHETALGRICMRSRRRGGVHARRLGDVSEIRSRQRCDGLPAGCRHHRPALLARSRDRGDGIVRGDVRFRVRAAARHVYRRRRSVSPYLCHHARGRPRHLPARREHPAPGSGAGRAARSKPRPSEFAASLLGLDLARSAHAARRHGGASSSLAEQRGETERQRSGRRWRKACSTSPGKCRSTWRRCCR